MPGAGFYSIHTNKLSFRADGRWYADDEPVLHERLASLFSRHVRRRAQGGYEIWIDERYHADVEIEDTPYVVTDLEIVPTGQITVILNDATREVVQPESLQVGDHEVLYCSVKNGAERARFLRSAYYHLAPLIEENASGQFQIRCGQIVYPIRRR
jgi:hypothetical protein